MRVDPCQIVHIHLHVMRNLFYIYYFLFFANKLLAAAYFFFFILKNSYRFADTEWSTSGSGTKRNPGTRFLDFFVSCPHWSHVDLWLHKQSQLHKSWAEVVFFYSFFNPFVVFIPHELSSHFQFFLYSSLICSVSEHTAWQRICYFLFVFFGCCFLNVIICI